jgi:hypothetical protein
MFARLTKFAIWFSIGSLVLFVLSFVVDSAAQIPAVAKILSGHTVKARGGVAQLLRTDALSPADVGFIQLAEIVMRHTTNSPMSVIPKIERFSFEAMIGMGEHGPATTGQALIHFSNGQQLATTHGALESMVQDAFDSRIFLWATFLFCLGLVDGIFAIIIEHPPRKKRVSKRKNPRDSVTDNSSKNQEDEDTKKSITATDT